MSGIVEHVDVEGQVPRGPAERSDELVDQDLFQTPQRSDVDGVLEAGQSGLAGQLLARRRAPSEDFEDRIVTQHVVVILVGIVGQDAVDPHAGHFRKAVGGLLRATWIVQGGRKLGRQADLLVKLTDGQEPRITGQLGLLRGDDNRLLREKVQ